MFSLVHLLCLYISIGFSVGYFILFWFGVVLVKLLQVLCGWRRWVTELQLKQEQAAGAAQTDRDEPLMEDVKYCLTSAAHMKALTAGLAEDSQEQVATCGISQFLDLMGKNTTLSIIRCPGN